MTEKRTDAETDDGQPEVAAVALPEQKQFFKIPARFGHVPVAEQPMGYDPERRFEQHYPRIELPFQLVDTVETAAKRRYTKDELFPNGLNRLFFGDCLHVMRMLPSECIDLIYIDPPFFSGRNYNIIFGDKNEVRSFTDIWEGGMPGYLIWLNARLYEMKRLLKTTGSIFVHLDWHAVHYVRVEMDKIYGAENFQNELIWHYQTGGASKSRYSRKHDTILWYSRSTSRWMFRGERITIPRTEKAMARAQNPIGARISADDAMKNPNDVLVIQQMTPMAKERIGYPTQKPEALLEVLLKASSDEGHVVADFFCGGGTTPAVAQRLNRRWVACDQSRIAVAITADRVTKVVREQVGALFPVPDFTVEHWGIYEAPRLETYSETQFREFVVRAFGGKPESVSPAIHGVRYGVPLYVGEPSRRSRIGKSDVARFAKAVYEERRANHGVMLAWNFGPDARKAAEILAARENKRIDFVRLSLIRLESEEFREHVLSKHQDYGPLLSFIQPPEVRVAVRRVRPLTCEFDVSESVSLNKDGAIANVQWDFQHQVGKFISTQGYTFLRDKKTQHPVLIVEYTFPEAGTHTVACSVQDDQGGERTVVQVIEVS